MRKFLFLSLTSIALTSCISFDFNITSSGDESDGNGGEAASSQRQSETSPSSTAAGQSSASQASEEEASNAEGLTILHAWDWKLTDIQTRLYDIKQAGYDAIQISPLQPNVDGSQWINETTSSQWWKLYQPLAYEIADQSSQNFIGTKADLTALCAAARTKGIKIIQDVVFNHLAGKNKDYSDQVWTRYPTHNEEKATDNSVKSVVQGHIGMPDIDTSNATVQSDGAQLLKDYLDCGVYGFRFDAAKHIETPDDGAYASSFWPTVLNAAKQYAQAKGYEEPYFYGEILNTAGNGRSFSQYTSMMDICDNNQASNLTDAINKNDLSKVKTAYNTKESPEKLVLWAESHDTYCNDDGYEKTRDISIQKIHKSYILQSSRKHASTLYFARPNSMDALMCSVYDDCGYRNHEIKMIHKFHRHYLNASESISKNNGCVVNVRNDGAVIVRISGSSSNIDIALPDGNYVDLVSNAAFAIAGNKINTNNEILILVPESIADQFVDNTPSYAYDVTLLGAKSGKYYSAWLFNGGGTDKWVRFQQDQDGLGFNMEGYHSYIIVERNDDQLSWTGINWQTENMSYTGKTILDYDALPIK